jgi:hypothetical protein
MGWVDRMDTEERHTFLFINMLLKIKAEIIGFTLEYRQAEREVVGNSIRNINLVLVEPSLKLGQSYKGVKSGFSMLYEQPSRREAPMS